jgi:uracil-DNA glycosylase
LRPRPTAVTAPDGLILHRCYITAALRCAPPQNKPVPQELRNCQPYLEQETRLLPRVRAVLALGRIAFDTYLRLVYSGRPAPAVTLPRRSSLRYGHGVTYDLPGLPRLFASYHPSQQNTQTGRLTRTMMASVLASVQEFLTQNRY